MGKDKRTLHSRCRAFIGGAGQAGHLLAEICYFWQVGMYRQNGKYWIVGTAEEFGERFGMSRNEYKLALKKLKDAGYIEVRHAPHPYKPSTLRATWITVVKDIEVEFKLKSPSPFKAKEVTYKLAQKQPTKSTHNQPTHTYKGNKLITKSQKGESGLSENSVFKEGGQGEQKEVMLEKFMALWKKAYEDHGHGHAQTWKKSEIQKFALPILEEASWNLMKLEKTIYATFPQEEWGSFCSEVEKTKGWDSKIPSKPSLAFVRQVVGTWFDYGKGDLTPKHEFKHSSVLG